MKVAVKFTVEPTITLVAEYEQEQVKGNAVASGDDAFDKKVEDEILRRLRDGDVWAWCCVTVRAEWHGFMGYDVLGCVSEKSEESFKKGSGYYAGMVANAKADLKQKVEAAAAAILDDLEVEE